MAKKINSYDIAPLVDKALHIVYSTPKCPDSRFPGSGFPDFLITTE